MTGLGDLGGGAFQSTAYAVSGDGRVVVGGGTSSDATAYHSAVRPSASEAQGFESGTALRLEVLPLRRVGARA